MDDNQANVRIWRNRVTNARMGVSLQPIAGGPAYVLRNELVNLESVPIKMQNDTAGFYVLHNSGAKIGNGYGDHSALWRNAVLRNNVFFGTEYAFEFISTASDGFGDFDYNAWGTTRQGAPWFKWDNTRFTTVDELPAGVEDNGIVVSRPDFGSIALGADWNVAVDAGAVDFSPATAAVVDAGEVIPNVNDPFVTDGAPDLGAIEQGTSAPSYGPRN